MCILCNLDRLHLALADKKRNVKQEKQSNNPMLALFE